LLRFCIATAIACLFCFIFDSAFAQSDTLHLRFGFDGTVDCDQPQKVTGFPIHGTGTGVIYTDRRASLDLSVRGSTTNRIHFDATLGGAPTPAPGGTAQLRVASANSLRMVWDLPNSDFVVNLTATKHPVPSESTPTSSADRDSTRCSTVASSSFAASRE
jgi:hypothetical protein